MKKWLLLAAVLSAFQLTNAQIVITEIMYNPNSSESGGAAVSTNTQYIEIANTSNVMVDLSNWTIGDEDEDPDTIPAGTNIPPLGILVLVDTDVSPADFVFSWPTAQSTQIIPLTDDFFNLSNSPSLTVPSEIEEIELRDASDNLVDVVMYDDSGIWPSDNPDGPSIYLSANNISNASVLANLDNNDGANWERSVNSTEGAINSTGLGTTFTSTNDVGSPGVVGSGSVLPIRLSKFEAELLQDMVAISWATQSEINNSHFEIERSHNGLDFSTLASIEGNGNSVQEVLYEYLDRHPLVGINYYRLKQVDYDGAGHFSSVISVNYNAAATALITSYANPVFGDQLQLNLNPSENGTLELDILGLNGQVLRSNRWKTIENQSMNIAMEVSDIPPGIYIMRAQLNAKVSWHKIMIE